jgi:hypothetical protein
MIDTMGSFWLRNTANGRSIMSIWNYTPKLDLWSGLAIGAGFLLAPVVLPMVAGIARPIVKGALKGAFRVYEGGREFVTDTANGVENLIEEVQAEVREELVKAEE